MEMLRIMPCKPQYGADIDVLRVYYRDKKSMNDFYQCTAYLCWLYNGRKSRLDILIKKYGGL